MEIEQQLKAALDRLQKEKITRYNRRVSAGDLLTERDENARMYGWGKGSTCYDNVLVIGDVKVGENTWIGPNVILDGSGGGLQIGDYCSICAGVQIYTHDTVLWSITSGKAPFAHGAAKIGSGVYIGPASIISRGVTIGDRAVIGALSFVNRDIPPGTLAFGQPARARGAIVPSGDN